MRYTVSREPIGVENSVGGVSVVQNGTFFNNGIAPQILWWKKARTSIPTLFILSLVVSVGMWLERFVIIITSLYREFLPSKWTMYYPSAIDWTTYIGTFGLFFTLFLLFCRFLPVIAVAEMKELLHHENHRKHGHDDHGAHAHSASHVVVEEGNVGDVESLDGSAHTAEPKVVPSGA